MKRAVVRSLEIIEEATKTFLKALGEIPRDSLAEHWRIKRCAYTQILWRRLQMYEDSEGRLPNLMPKLRKILEVENERIQQIECPIPRGLGSN